MNQLKETLTKLDGKSYKALKSICGLYKGSFYTLSIDYVQGDPFAAPSKVRLIVPLKNTDLQETDFSTYDRKVAFEHTFTSFFSKVIATIPNHIKGTGKSGLVTIDTPGQEVIEQSSVSISTESIEFRFYIGLPARGRTILGKQGIQLLCEYLPKVLKKVINEYDREYLKGMIQLADDQKIIRDYLRSNDIVSFIANDSILPRESGHSEKPLSRKKAIPFLSPKEYEVTIPLSNDRIIKGMGIPKGITLIVGGGFHGKSTLLKGIQKGVYNHKIGDGREFVLTEDSAVKIRAEDGRAVHNVNISNFINELPFGKNTVSFSTEDASGSTSQAANIAEAMEMDTSLLLIDEDTSATNFMIRDGRMQQLVQKEKEPITPFIDQVKPLFEKEKISTILVIGGSGDYFDVADHVIMMEEYRAFDRTEKAMNIAKKNNTNRNVEASNISVPSHARRNFEWDYINRKLGSKGKISNKGLYTIMIDRESLQLHAIEQLINSSQTKTITYMIRYLLKENKRKNEPIKESINNLYDDIENKGIDVLSSSLDKYPVDLAMPRKFELAAVINRIRY
ncbi:ABC-ATPase domain-containing protein [Evansella sp. AB-P1]|uniref:ABC-ATPase domain-containing protein n=1 Tax=Evansella sp. AB-P1 TaxID=3037653 RepID=UPI00241F44FA|nr:ABC-ATPase domain-containing protein [Evansella sp. AB-P1]MDG5787502.1 ABC-ATPase domain-containing protein [Evansella sp. AB-P1]